MVSSKENKSLVLSVGREEKVRRLTRPVGLATQAIFSVAIAKLPWLSIALPVFELPQ